MRDDSTPSGYEFSPADGRELDALGAALARGGALLYVLSPLLVVLAFEALLTLRALGPGASILGVLAGASLGAAFIAVVLARWMRRASKHCVAVATTSGDDLTHALDAMRSVGAVMRVLRGAVVAVGALIAVALVARLTRM